MLGLPTNGRTRRRADEEQLAGIGSVEVFCLLADGGGFAKVDSCPHISHERGTVEMLADPDGGFGVIEGADDAAERLQGRKGVEWGKRVDVLADSGDGGRVEDCRVVELRD